MIFTNGRVVTPDGICDDVDVVIQAGKIADLTPRSARAEAIDLRGNYLAPGFVDLHVHGALGQDTMEASVDAFRAICAYHASGGTTSMLLTTATAPIKTISAVLQAVRACQGQIPQLRGVHVEGPFISPERRGAQRQEFIRNPERALVDRLLEFSDVIRRVTLAPELPGAVEAIRMLVDRGIAVSGGHSDAWEEEARAGFEAGMRHVTHTFNCMSSARRREGQRVAGLLEFALSEPDIRCELIADGYHVSATLMKMLYRAKRADGICLVTDATAGAGLRNGEAFDLAGVPCVVRDGACFLADGSALAGSSARMIDLVRTMVCDVRVPLHEAIAMASTNPARAAAPSGKSSIETGADADLVVLSPQLDVLATYVAGEQIYASDRE
ncbi:MAG: N-acetylglucosamine-6-phosphate deacetylase [Chthoniobacterales bacterium]